MPAKQPLVLDAGKFAAIERRLFRELSHLGSTAELVAASLQDREIRGRRGSPRECPLSKFVSTVLPAHIRAAAPVNHVVTVPRACKEFIRRFDAGEWPELAE